MNRSSSFLFGGLAAGALWLGGCAAAPARSLDLHAPVPTSALIEEVPFVAQEKFHCGPASLSMLFAWSGRARSADELAGKIFTPGRRGSFQSDVFGATRREGMVALPVERFETLYREVAAGHPVMVLQNLGLSWWPRWHYAVVTGYDLEDKTIRLHSAHDRNEWFGLERFAREWGGSGQWGIVIVKPGGFSETADELAYLEAGSGLERVGRLDEAEKVYRSVRGRWPRSLGAAIGLGNVLYEKKDPRQAANVLRAATRDHASVAALWHNLAIAQGESGQTKLARSAAAKAMELAPEQESEAYRRDLGKWLAE